MPTVGLRKLFEKEKTRARNAIVREVAFSDAILSKGIGNISFHTMFQNIDFDKVYDKGITRRVGNKTVRYTGEEAVRVQIEAFRNRANRTVQKRGFIDNYLTSMRKVGFDERDIEIIGNQLSRLGADRVTYLINRGILPSISYIYTEPDYDSALNRIRDAIRTGAPVEEVRRIRERARKLEIPYREVFKIKQW